MRMLWRTKIGCLAIVVGASALTGCDQNKTDENALLMDEVSTLRTALKDENSAHRQEVAELREELRALKQQPAVAPQAGANPFDAIPGVTTQVTDKQITASIASDLLFDSGSTRLKSAAKSSLDQVASLLKGNYNGQYILIAGHTDTDPIRKSGHKTNWHLGFERGFAVSEYLISRGVPADRIGIESYGPYRGKGSKAKSRRVDIIVVAG